MASEELKNILVIKLDHIGDVLWATPSLSTLRKNLPGARIVMLCTRYTEPALRGNPDIDGVIIYDRESLPSNRDKKKFLKDAMTRPDLALCLDPRDEAVLLAYLSEAKIRAGYYLPDKPISVLKSMARLNRRYVHPAMMEKNKAGFPHEVDADLALLDMLGLGSEPERETRIYLSEDEKNGAEKFLSERGVKDEPLIMWHLPLKWKEGGWGDDYLISLGRGLSELIPGGRLLVTCGPGEEELLNSIKADLPAGTVAAAGLDFRIWAALFPHSCVVVSRDCGAVHVAAALGTPVVSVFEEFKRKEHARWEPWGVPHVNIFRPEKMTGEGFEKNIGEIINGTKKLLEESL